ncbi:MAG: DsbA family oxidoreductase [Mogibacterium sp.]|nr:DsbA family oxidoreductase [Mogibacterium sp.]
MIVKYWSDFACPFCYIGETSLKQVITNLGRDHEIQLEMKAFELDPDGSRHYEGPTDERYSKKYGYSLEETRKSIDDINARGASIGLDMHYDKSRYTNTFDAHRVTKLAQSKGDDKLVDTLQERLFKAYFTDGLELADHDVLIKLASESGLAAQEVQEVLLTDRYEAEVRRDEMEARAANVHGVPFFVIDDKYAIPGAISIEQMENVLRKLLQDREQTISI